MSDWQEVRLKDICTNIQYGYTESANNEVVGPKFLRITDIVKESIQWDTVPYCPITDKDFNKYKLCKGDIVVARTGNTTGWAKLIRHNVKSVFASYLVRFQLDKNIAYAGYVGRIIESNIFKDYVWSIIGGSAQPGANAVFLSNFIFNLPPLPIQQKIAKILSNYDDLIENNLKRIKLLEESAKLTYEEWFLRFKIDGKKLEVDPDSGLPFGWEKKNLGDFVNNYDNQRRPLSGMVREGRSGDYPYYGAAAVLDYIDDFIFDGKYLLVGEDGTVITKNGTPKLQFINCKFWVNNHAHILTGKNISTEFLYLTLNVYPISNHITGAAEPKINQQNLNRIPMIIANEDLMFDLDKIILPIFKQIFKLKEQSQLLKEARDILLPRLMTGMINTDELDVAV